MSYQEYFNMFKKTQKKECPYRAFMLDIIGSRTQLQYSKENIVFHKFIDEVYRLLEEEEKATNIPILLKDENNKTRNGRIGINGNLYNPMTLGDMATYFVYNDSISIERFVELSVQAMRKYDLSYGFHFSTGVYETNDYGEGGTRMYKGYMPQILESLSKGNGIVISKDSDYSIEGM